MLFRLLGWRGRQQRRKQAGGKFTPVSHRFLFALKRRIYCLSRDLMYVIVTHSQIEILTCHFYFFATQSCDYTPKIVLKLL